MVYLTRRYRFCASHRLHNEALTDEANLRIYGKCDSPFGHGHNYVLEVTVKGPIDQETGMVFDLVALDGIVEKEVLERFDYTNLNLDVENFSRRVPTTENVCERIYSSARAPSCRTADLCTRPAWLACGWRRPVRISLNTRATDD